MRNEEVMTLWDVTNNVVGGIGVVGLPLAPMVPGLVALLALCIPLVLVLVALGLVVAILSAPLIGIWALLRRRGA